MRREKILYSGIDGIFYSIYGFGKRLHYSRKRLRADAQLAIGEAERTEILTDSDFSELLVEYRSRLRKKPGPADVPKALGAISAAVKRIIGISPYIEQLMGALCMGSNTAIQMQTGEGKTITAAMSAVMAAWRGGPCHVVTSNDYLAKRDAELMKPFFSRCGVSAGYVISGMKPGERRDAYFCDITYSTSKELLADFLRDKMAEEQKPDLFRSAAGGMTSKVMRGLHTAIIDEADSVLIDEATVPLIISMPNSNHLLHEAVMTAKRLSESLEITRDFIPTGRGLEIRLTEAGKDRIATVISDLPAIWHSEERAEFLVCQALVARHCYKRDVHYVVVDGKVVIVDDRTGRIMEGRSWSGGLHQAIEAIEGVELTDPTYSHTQMSFQLFFRLYRHLAGMSGTLQNVADELWTIYGLKTVRIPTHKPKRVLHYRERIFLSSDEKWSAVVSEALRVVEEGRAVLIGTRSVRESEELHLRFSNAGIDAVVLNALRHEQEAQIVAEAGTVGRVTIATNMAGRGTDIIVSGDVVDRGGLHVIATERHESRRVDMQLFGRTARQGVQGSVQMLTSLADAIVVHYAWPWVVRCMKSLVSVPWGELAALQINRINQRRADSAKARLRKRILLQDIRQTKLLSFANH
ncbi:MAG: prepilin peptidase [Deltaproteobacteria bacterium]|nr:prepilin peptidase [Deltaproteobacteria bacterium]